MIPDLHLRACAKEDGGLCPKSRNTQYQARTRARYRHRHRVPCLLASLGLRLTHRSRHGTRGRVKSLLADESESADQDDQKLQAENDPQSDHCADDAGNGLADPTTAVLRRGRAT